MSLLEFLGETIQPGKTGTIDVNKGKKEKGIGVLILKTILSIVIVVGLYYLIFGKSFQIKEFLAFAFVIVIYSIISYFVLPKPEYSNLGWFGGLIDNPFKISDDVNRMLIFIRVLLIPGRLISSTFVSWIQLLKK